MSIRAIQVTLTHYGDDGSSARVEVERLLGRFMPDRFRPATLSGLWAGRTVSPAPETADTWEGAALWPGEVPAGDGLTRWRDGVAPLPPVEGEEDYACTWEGALRHRPPLEAAEEDWYARIRLPGDDEVPSRLVTIAKVALEHAGLTPSVTISFPFGGYPLTSVSPRLGENDGLQRAPVPELIEANRRALCGWIERLPEQLGWKTELEWEINADDALYDDDFEALKSWQRRLQEGGA